MTDRTLVRHRYEEPFPQFLGNLTVDAVTALQDQVVSGLTASVQSWPERGAVRLYDELVEVYGDAVLGWAAGCTYPEAEHVSRDLVMIEGGGSRFRPLAQARARAARRRADAWARGLLEDARRGIRQPRPGSAADAFARGPGALLPLEVAAVELVDALRPTVAVAWLGTFAALLLAQRPEHGERLLSDLAFRVAFAHEVRRRATGRCCPGDDLTTALLTVTLQVLAGTAFTVVDGRTGHGRELTDVRVRAPGGPDTPR